MAIIRMKTNSILAIALLVAALSSCKSDVCDTPFGEGGVFDLSLPSFSPLIPVGGTMVIHYDNYGFEVGHRGIFVRHATLYEFVAFDCTCPKDHDIALQPADGWDGAVLECPACGSKFETEYGNPLDGAETSCPLYSYTAHYDGGYVLEIYN